MKNERNEFMFEHMLKVTQGKAAKIDASMRSIFEHLQSHREWAALTAIKNEYTRFVAWCRETPNDSHDSPHIYQYPVMVTALSKEDVGGENRDAAGRVGQPLAPDDP